MIFKRLCFAYLPMLAAIFGAGGAGAQADLEMSVKAAFLPKFAAYVTWPAGALGADNEPVQICVIGQDPFGAKLDDAAESERIGPHTVEIRRIDDTENATGCNVAFLSRSAKETVAVMLTALRGQPILTVTDARIGPEHGMVHFQLDRGRVRFHVDDQLAASGNLTFNARLLGLALTVRPRARA